MGGFEQGRNLLPEIDTWMLNDLLSRRCGDFDKTRSGLDNGPQDLMQPMANRQGTRTQRPNQHFSQNGYDTPAVV